MLYGAGGLEDRGRPSDGVPREEYERVLARGKTRREGASWSAIGPKPLGKRSLSQVHSDLRKAALRSPPSRNSPTVCQS
jgi:hypothetical protein